MEVIVPYDAARPKTRLASTLDADERRAFADAMLADVTRSVRAAGHEPHVLTTERIDTAAETTVDDRPLTEAVNAQLVARDPSPDAPTAILMADLPLVTPATVRRLTTPAPPDAHDESDRTTPTTTGDPGERADAVTTDDPTARDDPAARDDPEARNEPTATEDVTTDEPADVTIAPGLGGGTNALVVRDPAFRVDYHGASCRDHDRIAREASGTVRTVDSRRLATDVDEPADLAEVLLHADGAARAWLGDAGFRLVTGDGRVTVER